MEHKCFSISFLVSISFLFCGFVHAEVVVPVGDYTTAGDVNGDLIVINGDVNVTGDLSVHGDLKVTGGKVGLTNGTLSVNGDLIVTNTSVDATVIVYGDLSVSGAIITKGNSNAYVKVTEALSGPTQGGFLSAGRISTDALFYTYVEADHHITVSGSIVTNSRNTTPDLPIGDSAYVRSNGSTPPYGNIYAGSIFTNAPGGSGYVKADNGNIKVNGPIITKADDAAYVYAEGSIEAEYMSTRSTCSSAYISGEKVDVIGDIRTLSQSWLAFVEARKTSLSGQEGTFEDVIAQNIYTKGVESAYVRAYRSIDVRGDIVTWDIDEAAVPCGAECDICANYAVGVNTNPRGAFIFAGDLDGIAKSFRSPTANRGNIKAQNIMTISQEDGSVVSNGSINVSGDIIAKSIGTGDGAYIYTYSGDIVAGNIAAMGEPYAYVESELGNILVSNVISTTHVSVLGGEGAVLKSPIFRVIPPSLYRGDVVATSGDIEAEKIFAFSFGDADIEGGSIDVKGPIDARSLLNTADVIAWIGDISAGAISVYESSSAYVESLNGSINVREDIRARGFGGDMRLGPRVSVSAENGSISARSIKADGTEQTWIKAAAGSGNFQLLLHKGGTGGAGTVLLIKDCEFDLDRDYVLDTVLAVDGTCTLNGKGHHLDLGTNGRIQVGVGAGSASLLLKNTKLRGLSGATALMCLDNTCTLSLHNVELTMKGATSFSNGNMQVFGDVVVKTSEGTQDTTEFTYGSAGLLTINKNAKLMFDRRVLLSYNSSTEDRINMVDSSSRLHFDGGALTATKDIRLINGTLRIDNYVTFRAAPGGGGEFLSPIIKGLVTRGVQVTGTIYFGNNNAANNLGLEFGEQAKLSYIGVPIEYENV